MAIIKEAYAKQLKEQGIVSHCDLLRKADTPSAQEALAKKLGISTMLLRRWTLLADLMRIVGDTQYVNLLEAADAGSLDALEKVSDPCELANLLKQINQAQSLVKQSPRRRRDSEIKKLCASVSGMKNGTTSTGNCKSTKQQF